MRPRLENKLGGEKRNALSLPFVSVTKPATLPAPLMCCGKTFVPPMSVSAPLKTNPRATPFVVGRVAGDLPGVVDAERAIIRTAERTEINQTHARRVAPRPRGVRAAGRVAADLPAGIDARGDAGVRAERGDAVGLGGSRSRGKQAQRDETRMLGQFHNSSVRFGFGEPRPCLRHKV